MPEQELTSLYTRRARVRISSIDCVGSADWAWAGAAEAEAEAEVEAARMGAAGARTARRAARRDMATWWRGGWKMSWEGGTVGLCVVGGC